MTFFHKVRVLFMTLFVEICISKIFALIDNCSSLRSHFLKMWNSHIIFVFVSGGFIGIIGGTPDNVFLRVYFDVFGQSSCFNFRPSKQSSVYVFGVFIGIIKWGDP